MTNDVELVEGEVVITNNDIQVLDKSEAEQLTKDIQSTTTALYVLLKRAHDTKAWLSMGYNTWTEYIENEFNFSRARSYQLLNQANVIEEINEASGVPLYITEKEARSIKKRLPEITEKLKEIKEADLTEEEAEEQVKEVIEESKEDIDNSENVGEPSEKEYDDESDESSNLNNDNYSYELSEEDKFYHEKLSVTLQIFDSMPNPSLLGEKLKKAGANKEDFKKQAESAQEWISKFISQL